ncbi:DUF3857 domain-containing protein [Aquimarina longa]|uniref:DUF3857 domain-containing protein n=1 Tax=Aquimarina longa TaxID=1080221 RepID=UPI00078190F3|nr:DUF3857 domain-containing protein [Aquimarina longa]
MNNFIFLLLFLILTIHITAQETYNSKNMIVSIADLKGSTYKKDTTANAFFIYEKGYSRVQNGGNYNLLTDYEAKIKILNEQGYNKAVVKIFLYKNKGNKELLKKLVAHTYTIENGEIIKNKVNDDQIYKEKYDENYTLIKFTFPNLKPGSVLTYKYQTESPFMYNFNGWDFQDDIPKMYSEFTADLPGNYIYNTRLIGTLKLETNESSIKKNCLEISSLGYADCAHGVYTMRNIPAFKKEKYMTTKGNYFSRIKYELKEFTGFDGKKKKYTKTWKNVDYKLEKEITIGVQLKKINLTKKVLPDSIKLMPNNISKAKAIYRYITNNYSWNKKNQIFKEGNINKVIENKTGNSSEINILLHNVLKQQKFNVHPVILSTRDNGYITKIHPIISDFNYLIVQLSIDKKPFLLDATEKNLKFGDIPFRCLNQDGRLLDFKNGSSWISITPRESSSFFYKEKLKLTKNLKLNGYAKHILTGYHSYFKRKELDQFNKKKFLDQIKKQSEDISITDIAIKNENDPNKNYEEEFDFIKSPEVIDDLIYIKPFTKPFFKENPFKLNERTYPVDFGYKDSYTYYISIELPLDYNFVDIPKNSNYTIPNNLGSVSTKFSRNKNKLTISHRIAFNSSYYPTEYYSTLKELLNLVVEIENNTIITVKR